MPGLVTTRRRDEIDSSASLDESARIGPDLPPVFSVRRSGVGAPLGAALRRDEGALERHDAILREAVEKRDGRVVKTTGDGIHPVFSIASDAAAAALDAQPRLTGETWMSAEPLRVRMGLRSWFVPIDDTIYSSP